MGGSRHRLVVVGLVVVLAFAGCASLLPESGAEGEPATTATGPSVFG